MLGAMGGHRATWIAGLAAGWVLAALVVAGCGGMSRAEGERLLPDLRQRITHPVDTRAQSADNSRVVEKVVDSNALQGMTQEQVRQAIGVGDDCSRHPKCGELGFQDDDWYYTVGTLGRGAAQAPLLIVGFDTSGKVVRTWNMRTN